MHRAFRKIEKHAAGLRAKFRSVPRRNCAIPSKISNICCKRCVSLDHAVVCLKAGFGFLRVLGRIHLLGFTRIGDDKRRVEISRVSRGGYRAF